MSALNINIIFILSIGILFLQDVASMNHNRVRRSDSANSLIDLASSSLAEISSRGLEILMNPSDGLKNLLVKSGNRPETAMPKMTDDMSLNQLIETIKKQLKMIESIVATAGKIIIGEVKGLVGSTRKTRQTENSRGVLANTINSFAQQVNTVETVATNAGIGILSALQGATITGPRPPRSAAPDLLDALLQGVGDEVAAIMSVITEGGNECGDFNARRRRQALLNERLKRQIAPEAAGAVAEILNTVAQQVGELTEGGIAVAENLLGTVLASQAAVIHGIMGDNGEGFGAILNLLGVREMDEFDLSELSERFRRETFAMNNLPEENYYDSEEGVLEIEEESDSDGYEELKKTRVNLMEIMKKKSLANKNYDNGDKFYFYPGAQEGQTFKEIMNRPQKVVMEAEGELRIKDSQSDEKMAVQAAMEVEEFLKNLIEMLSKTENASSSSGESNGEDNEISISVPDSSENNISNSD